MQLVADFIQHVVFAICTLPFIILARNAGTWCKNLFDDLEHHRIHAHVMQSHRSNVAACMEGDCAVTVPGLAHQ